MTPYQRRPSAPILSPTQSSTSQTSSKDISSGETNISHARSNSLLVQDENSKNISNSTSSSLLETNKSLGNENPDLGESKPSKNPWWRNIFKSPPTRRKSVSRSKKSPKLDSNYAAAEDLGFEPVCPAVATIIPDHPSRRRFSPVSHSSSESKAKNHILKLDFENEMKFTSSADQIRAQLLAFDLNLDRPASTPPLESPLQPTGILPDSNSIFSQSETFMSTSPHDRNMCQLNNPKIEPGVHKRPSLSDISHIRTNSGSEVGYDQENDKKSDHSTNPNTSNQLNTLPRSTSSWKVPESWGYLSEDTYILNYTALNRNVEVDFTKNSNASLRKPSVSDEQVSSQIWNLRVFKPVESADGEFGQIMASSGFTYTTVSVMENIRAAELCLILSHKFKSVHDLTKFRLHFINQHTERLIAHWEYPIKLFKESHMRIGHDESDRLWCLAREDHSYCCRFVFREYPPPPPKPEDFVSPLDFENLNDLEFGQAESTSTVNHNPDLKTKSETDSQLQSRIFNKKSDDVKKLNFRTGKGPSKAKIKDKSAYLAGVNLSVAPTLLFKYADTIQFLDLSRNTLLDLPGDLFARLKSLRMVRLVGNLLEDVPLALLQAPSITHLDLSSNKLTGSSLAALNNLPNLTHLNISCNRIAHLSDNLSPTQALNLRNLDISSNYLKQIPNCIFHMSAIRDLNMSFNQITSIPSEIKYLRGLRTLLLVGNSISCLDESVAELPNLRMLDVRGNLINRIATSNRPQVSEYSTIDPKISPDSLDTAKLISSIDQKSRDTNYMPGLKPYLGSSEFGSDNRSDQMVLNSVVESVDEIDKNYAEMPETVINYSKNERFTKVANSSSNLSVPQLLEVHADYNKLNVISATPNWPLLTTFSASRNHLVEIPFCTKLVSLRNLNLSHGQLLQIPEDLFLNTPYLENIILSHNKLTRLPLSISNLNLLISLNAHSNLLSELSLQGSSMTSLTKLILHTNNISHVAPSIWDFPNLRVLNISSNFVVTMPDPPKQYATSDYYDHSFSAMDKEPNDVESFIKYDSSESKPHIPPLALCLEEFLAADNRINDEISEFLIYMRKLTVLNLAYNRIFGLEEECLRRLGPSLTELVLSGNMLTSVPSGIDNCTQLRILFINDNKIVNLPGELAACRSLLVFDAQSNTLRYNVANWPYDWNWNYSVGLRYLSLAHNRKLEIKTSTGAISTDFKSMHRLRVLDLTGVSISPHCLPEKATDLQLRVSGAGNSNEEISVISGHTAAYSSPGSVLHGGSSAEPDSAFPGQKLSEAYPKNYTSSDGQRLVPNKSNGNSSRLRLAFAEYCGRDITFDQTELVRNRFMGQDTDHLVGLFDGKGHNYISAFLADTIPEHVRLELRRLQEGEDFGSALRRAFLSTNRELSSHPHAMRQFGSTACVIYILESRIYVANVGDTMAILSREGHAECLTKRHHAWNRDEQNRIRSLGGFISLQGLVEREIGLTRTFGHHALLPYVNACPSVRCVELQPTDEFILVATYSFWEVMLYQTAVDVARRDRGDPDLAVQKLRDMAVARGAVGTMKILFIDMHGIVLSSISTKIQKEAPEQVLTRLVERRKTAFKRQEINDQVLSRLEDEIPPPRPPCSFVFTDIKDSTKIWNHKSNAMRIAIKQHYETVRRLLRIHRGYEMKNEGDSFVIAFQNPFAALRFCIAVQEHLLNFEYWPQEILNFIPTKPVYSEDGKTLLYRGLSLRMGIHHGMADDAIDLVANRMDYHGIDIAIASRIMNTADGGQINISDVVYEMISQALEGGNKEVNMQNSLPSIKIHNLGHRPIKGLDSTINVHAVYPQALAERFLVRTDSTAKGVDDFNESENQPIGSPTEDVRWHRSSVTISDILGSSTDTDTERRPSSGLMAATEKNQGQNAPSRLSFSNAIVNQSLLSVYSIPEEEEEEHNFSDVDQ